MKLIFDIGYNVGAFTNECFKKHPNVYVVAVEANPRLGNILNSDRFYIWNRVVSDRDEEEIDFYVSPKWTGVSTASLFFMKNSRFKKGSRNLKKNSIKWMSPIKVNSITLDTLIRTHGTPDLIKIDIEGYEYEAIMGLTNKAKDVCFEWHEEDYGSVVKIIDHLMILGYKKFGVIGWFDEGDVFEKATFSSKGGPHLVYPDRFYDWGDLDMLKLINPDRRINYGMLYAKT